MTIYLKQSTASQEVPLGPFVDSVDGVTAETGLTIANTDIKIWKAGATSLASKNSGGGTHMASGVYSAVFDATDSDTLGSMVVFIFASGALPVRHECVVLAANIYDSLIGGTDLFDVSVAQWLGTAAASPHTAGYPVVTVKDGTGTGEIDTTSGGVLVAAIAAGAITAAAIATDAIDADAMAANAIDSAVIATGAITAAKFAAGAIDAAAIAADAITAAKVASDVTTEIQSGLATAASLATVAGYLDTEIAAILAKTNLIPGTQDGKTFAETILLMAAALLGKASGLGTTTAVFRGIDDVKDRVTATVDASGNRSAVTLDATP